MSRSILLTAAIGCDCCEGVRDDPNGDGYRRRSDVTYVINCLFRDGP